MPLRFETADIKDRDILYSGPNQRIWSDWTDLMAHATITVGINHITEKNYEEFYERYVMFLHAHGVHEWLPTLEIVKKFIGLRTNAATLTPAAFKRSMLEILVDRTKIVIRAEKLDAERQTSITV